MTTTIVCLQEINYQKQKFLLRTLLLTVLCYSWISSAIIAQDASYDVMEVVEVAFNSQEQYNNPYIDVDVWVELKKSGSSTEVYHIPIFWDGGNVFRARLVATSPGSWNWNVINTTVANSDPAFLNKSGSFSANTADVNANPNNRGFIRTASNNRTLEYADGTPFFYTADTSWSSLTEVFGYNQANDITGISFQNYILARKRQGFNGLNVIASFPDDTYIGDFNKNKQFPNSRRGLWSDATWAKKVGPAGATPFEMKSPAESITDWSEEVDYRKINPKYWQSVDERMQFLSDQGFVTLFEAVRRHERWPFRTDASEKDAFYNYMRYLWGRYGCYNMIFSWVHLDSGAEVYKPWRSLVEHAHNKLSTQLGNQMPYGQPRTAMTFNTSLTNWGNPNDNASQSYPGIPDALDLQNVSNDGRDERMHQRLNDLFDNVKQPAINLEPFYPGWAISGDFNALTEGLDDTTMAQMQMYGSVLSGALAGHAWGDAWYAGAVETFGTITDRNVLKNDPQVNAIDAYESQAMGHLKTFMLDAGHEYEKLIPAADTHLSDNQNYIHTLSISEDEEFALGFFAGDSRSNPRPIPSLKNLTASKKYLFEWWNITTGSWISAGNITISNAGILQPPAFPNDDRSKNWAYRIRSEEYMAGQTEEEVEEEEEEELEEEEVEEEEVEEGFALRINSGGKEITLNENTFLADTYFNAGRTLDRPQTGLEDPFKTFRFNRSQVMGYDIPLENGEYTVRLHFAELWFGATGGGASGEGRRVFDVSMEDNLVEDNLDIFAQVGAEVVLTKTYTINVTDEQLNIDFSSLASVGGTRHPVINAIEILAYESSEEQEEQEEVEEDEQEDEQEEEEEELVPLEELIRHWPLDEQDGDSAEDVTEQGQTGTLENGLNFDTDKTIGQIGGAVIFDGLKDRISLPDFDDSLESNFSVSAWIKPSNAQGGYQGVLGSSTAGGFMMFINRGKLAFKVTTNENGQKLISAGSIENEVWQMITCTFDGNEMRWYINGENVHSELLSGTVKDRSVAWLGYSGWGDEYFEGGIDDARLFNKALTEQQVFSMFQEAKVNIAPRYLAITEPLTVERVQAFAYPNPTKGKFKITGLSSSEKEIIVLNFSGIVILTKETDSEEPELDLSAYPDGMYIVRVLQNALEQTFKIVKE